jgi:hypothetical protein
MGSLSDFFDDEKSTRTLDAVVGPRRRGLLRKAADFAVPILEGYNGYEHAVELTKKDKGFQAAGYTDPTNEAQMKRLGKKLQTAYEENKWFYRLGATCDSVDRLPGVVLGVAEVGLYVAGLVGLGTGAGIPPLMAGLGMEAGEELILEGAFKGPFIYALAKRGYHAEAAKLLGKEAMSSVVPVVNDVVDVVSSPYVNAAKAVIADQVRARYITESS